MSYKELNFLSFYTKDNMGQSHFLHSENFVSEISARFWFLDIQIKPKVRKYKESIASKTEGVLEVEGTWAKQFLAKK